MAQEKSICNEGSSLIDPIALNKQRLARLRSHLDESEYGALLLFDPINIRYATGLSNMQVFSMNWPIRHVLICAEGGSVHAFEFAHCEFMKDLTGTIDTIEQAECWLYLHSGEHMEHSARSWAERIAAIVGAEVPRNKRIGVDRLDWMGATALKSQGLRVGSCESILAQARFVKTDMEIRAMTEAVQTTEVAVSTMESMLAPGRTENQAMGAFLGELASLGGEHLVTRLLNSGPRTNPWYQETSDREMQAGDFLCLDTDAIGPLGYCCDLSRTFLVPGQKPNDQQRHIYALAYAHLERVISMIGPGVGLQEISNQVGTPNDEYWTYTSIAHGCGMAHEYPIIAWGHEDTERYSEVLVPNSIMCIESYCGWKQGGPGVKLEDQLLITDTGIRRLSTLPFLEDLI